MKAKCDIDAAYLHSLSPHKIQVDLLGTDPDTSFALSPTAITEVLDHAHKCGMDFIS